MKKQCYLTLLTIVAAMVLFFPLSSSALWFNPNAGTIFNTPGVPFTLNDDDHFGPIGMNMPFSFFGNTYTTVYFNSNGTLTFNAGRDSWDNYEFPRSGNDQFGDSIVPTIAPFFDDHDNRYGGTLSFINTLPQIFVASWDGVPLYGRDDVANTFQAALFGAGNPIGIPDGTIVFSYGDLQGTGGTCDNDCGSGGWESSLDTATLGLNNGDGVNYAVAYGLGIGNPGGIITPADFPFLENPSLDPLFFTPGAAGEPYILTAVPESDLPQIPGYTTGGGAPVPEPGTMILLGSGLAGIAAFRRKLKK